MSPLWRRLLAFAIDYALAFLLSALLLLPFEPPKTGHLAAFQPQQTLLFLLLIVASALFTQSARPSPGKRLLNLKVSGQGCAMCREVRRLGPLLALSVPGGLAPLIVFYGGTWPPPWYLSAIALAIAAAYYIPPLRTPGNIMPWDRATGLRVTQSG